MYPFIFGMLQGLLLGLLAILAWLLSSSIRARIASRRRARQSLALTQRDVARVEMLARELAARVQQAQPRPKAATGPTTRLGCAHDYPAGAAYCIQCGRPR